MNFEFEFIVWALDIYGTSQDRVVERMEEKSRPEPYFEGTIPAFAWYDSERHWTNLSHNAGRGI